MTAVTIPLTVTFTQAAAGLRRLRRPSFHTAQSSLYSAAYALRCARILLEIEPVRLAERPISGHALLGDAVTTYGQLAIEAIDNIAPLDTDAIEIGMAEEGVERLAPASMGYPMMWDDWYELVENPDSLVDDAEFWIFARCLLMEERESFDVFSEHFGWGLSYPRTNDSHYLDTEAMFRRLKKRGLGVFITAWKIANYETGNLYFDYNVYEDNEPLPDFSVEGARKLQKQYQEALPMQVEYRRAQRLFLEDSIPGVLMGIYRRSLVPRDKKPKTQVVSARTLAEVWGLTEQAAPMDEEALVDRLTDGNGLTAVIERITETNRQIRQELGEIERIIDPFYGPLDGREDEEAGNGFDD